MAIGKNCYIFRLRQEMDRIAFLLCHCHKSADEISDKLIILRPRAEHNLICDTGGTRNTKKNIAQRFYMMK